MSEDSNQMPEIHRAVTAGDKIKVLKLLEYGTDIEERDSLDKTGLFLAAESGNKALVQLFLDKGAEIDARCSTGYTPLHIACEMDCDNVVPLLIKHKADVNARESEWGSTPLIISSFWGHAKIVRMLLEAGADASICAYFDYAPIGCASVKGHYDVVKLLIDHKTGVDIETKTNNGFTPLLHAASNAFLETVDLLLNKGANIYAIDNKGTGIIHMVAANGNLDLLKSLTKRLANIKGKDHSGNTPLHTAVSNDHMNIAKALIQAGAEVNNQNKKGYTPLHLAAEKGSSDLVRYLQTIGADANTQTIDGDKPVDLAYFNDHMYVVELMKLITQPSANVEERKKEYYTRLATKSEGSSRSTSGPVAAPRKRTGSNPRKDSNHLSLPQRKGSNDSNGTYAVADPVSDRYKCDSGYLSFEPQASPCQRRRPAPAPPASGDQSLRHSYMVIPEMLRDPNQPESHYINLTGEDEGTSPTKPGIIRSRSDTDQEVPPPPGSSENQQYEYNGAQTLKPAVHRMHTMPPDHHHSDVHPDISKKKKGGKNLLNYIFGKHKKKKEEAAASVPVVSAETRPSMQVHNSIHKDVQKLNIDVSLKELVSSVYTDFSRLVLEDLIGRGNFGRVYLGRLMTNNEYQKIAVKTTKYRADERDMIDVFLREALIMKDFKHAHVLSLLGITFDVEGNPLALLPFMNQGNLRAYIRDPQKALSVQMLLKLGLQVGRGMEYLSKNKFVHRDLACRNCMIDQDDDHIIVKVADFGLSRDLYSKDYYRITDRTIPLPVRWMAPESMRANIFKLKSDVWSFGVLLWELLTRGTTPYSEVENWDIEKYIIKGRRLDKPKYCPDEIYGAMQSCWNIDPAQRPSFADIVVSIEDHMHSEMCSSNNVDPADALMGAQKMYFV